MPLYTYNPTSNQTPDPGQGGLAVSGNTNTGHGSTTSSTSDGNTQDRSCIWTGFPAGPLGQNSSVTLKAAFTENGSLTGAGAHNGLTLLYSLDGGATWSGTLYSSTDVVASNSGTVQASLSLTQNLTLVRVRDNLHAGTLNVGESASYTASISNIRIEVQTVGGLIVMM